MIAKISEFFHSGVPYIAVSVIFIVLTAYGLKVLIDIRKELRIMNGQDQGLYRGAEGHYRMDIKRVSKASEDTN